MRGLRVTVFQINESKGTDLINVVAVHTHKYLRLQRACVGLRGNTYSLNDDMQRKLS